MQAGYFVDLRKHICLIKLTQNAIFPWTSAGFVLFLSLEFPTFQATTGYTGSVVLLLAANVNRPRMGKRGYD